jgi:hypothetical protein
MFSTEEPLSKESGFFVCLGSRARKRGRSVRFLRRKLQFFELGERRNSSEHRKIAGALESRIFETLEHFSKEYSSVNV